MNIIAITNAAASIVWAAGIGPLRVEYTLNPSNVIQAQRASIAFRDDTNTCERIVGAYRDSGWDRGHLAPAADFNGNAEALRDTYLSSNLSPMRPSFNRGAWAQVEAAVRETAQRVGVPVSVTTIPVYGGTNTLGRCLIPSGFIKLISTNGVTIAAWLKEQEN